MTYHKSVSKELALALNLQQVDKKGVSLALGSAYKVRLKNPPRACAHEECSRSKEHISRGS